VDRGWWIVAANPGAAVLLDGVAPHLLERPNALRIALHPDGLAPRIRNLAQWRSHLIERLRREEYTRRGGATDIPPEANCSVWPARRCVAVCSFIARGRRSRAARWSSKRAACGRS